MKERIYDGGPAFPITDEQSANGITAEPGMSLRDYFAAKTMQGYVANPGEGFDTIKEAAAFCYEWADAMLKERERQS